MIKYSNQKNNSAEAKLDKYASIVANPLSRITTEKNPQISLNAKPIRNASGIADFKNMILQSNKNFNIEAAPKLNNTLRNAPFLAVLGKDYENVNLSNLSADAVSTIQNTSTIDVSIMAHLSSFAQFCAIERPMNTQNVQVSWRNLIDADTGEVFKDNFGFFPLDSEGLFAKKVNSSKDGIDGENILTIGSPVSPLKVTFTVTDASGEVVLQGDDSNTKGKFLYSINKIAGPESVTINYDTGVVVVQGPFDTYKLKVDAVASQGDVNGSNSKIITTQVEHVNLVADTVRIEYRDDALKQLIWNKNLDHSQVNGDLIADTTKQLSIAFVNNMNNRVMEKLIIAATTNGLPDHTYNIADYSITGSWSDTKYDMVGQSIMQTASEFVFDTDQGATSLFVTSTLAVLLNGIRNGTFVAASTIFSTNDGVVGTLNGMPVIRSRYLQKYEDFITEEALKINPVDEASGKPYVKIPFILANKMVDGSAATLVVGEFLPIFSTSIINNFNNTTQFANAFIAMNAVQIISKKMARIGYLIVDKTSNN